TRMSLYPEAGNNTSVTDPSTNCQLHLSLIIDSKARPPNLNKMWQLTGLGAGHHPDCTVLFKDLSRSLGTSLSRWSYSRDGRRAMGKLMDFNRQDATTNTDIMTEVREGVAQCLLEAEVEEWFRKRGTHVCESQGRKHCPFVEREPDHVGLSFALIVENSSTDSVSLGRRAWDAFVSLTGLGT
ncbi:MAG: hypothetical protein TREMPRED_005139, partial [Tremellales sp. Tagirdzhanova-0007]